LFNRLTGTYAAVSNYPGTTVDVATGACRLGGGDWEVVDTPGVRSMLAQSEDEVVTRDLILARNPAVIVQVADAKNIRTSLLLTAGLADLGIPMVLALNMSDEARHRGLIVDPGRLAERLGIPVVETVAVSGLGMEALSAAVGSARPPKPAPLPAEVETRVESLSAGLGGGSLGRFVGLSMLCGAGIPSTGTAAGEAASMRSSFAHPPEFLVHSAREDWAIRVEAEVVERCSAARPGWIQTLDRWSMQGGLGWLLAGGVLAVMYWIVGMLAAGSGVDFMEEVVFGRAVNPVVTGLVERFVPSSLLKEALVGPYGVFTMALTYAFAIVFPIVTAFFLVFGCLEDSGYLPRLSVLMDKAFRLMGLNGKAVIPMVLGLGCDTMATLSTRILDTKKERVVATMLLALGVPCSAQLGVIMGMLAKLGPAAALLWFVTVLGTLLVAGWGASKLLPGARAPFVLEIPPLRVPKAGNILLKIKTRLVWYLKEAVPLFLAATMALFILDKAGLIRTVEQGLAPLLEGLLGLPQETAWCFILGFLRRDYGAAGLFALAEKGLLSPGQSVVSLVAITLFLPCIAQFLVMVRERGARSALLISAFVTATALLVAAGLNIILALAPLV
ncbi:MAG: ferrous iron transporter B, partial [Elusimicrobiota bacterium]